MCDVVGTWIKVGVTRRGRGRERSRKGVGGGRNEPREAGMEGIRNEVGLYDRV